MNDMKWHSGKYSSGCIIIIIITMMIIIIINIIIDHTPWLLE